MQRDPYDEFKTPFRPRHPAEYTASRSTHGIGEKEIRVAAKPSALFDAGFSTPVQTASALKAAAPPAAPAAAAPIAVPNLYAASNPYAAQALLPTAAASAQTAAPIMSSVLPFVKQVEQPRLLRGLSQSASSPALRAKGHGSLLMTVPVALVLPSVVLFAEVPARSCRVPLNKFAS